ncbi:MAG: TfoX/Sxy family protein [Bauldia sp.]
MPRSRRSSTRNSGAGDRLPGLGPRSTLWLREVGVETEADLRSLGAVAAYRRLKHWDPKRVSLNMLYGLHAALSGIPISAVDAETKAQLKDEATD